MTARADIIRVLHQAYVDNGWMPPTLDGYADALMAAGYGKVDGDKVRLAKAAAWDEGWKAAQYSPFTSPPSGTNPYREPSS